MKVFCADGRIGDFSQLQFSAGKRQRAFHLRGQIDLEGRVLLQWEKVGGRGFVEDNDRLMVVVLHEGGRFVQGCWRILGVCGKMVRRVSRLTGGRGKRCICIVSLFRLMRSSYL